ncbi:MAG: radical SAM protein [Thermodesulfobacteriota bacterium]
MKVTLVYPGIAMIGFNSLGGNTHDTISINLGLGYLSAYLKKHSSHTSDLIDLRDLTGWEHYEKEILKRDPDVVGIYCNTVNYEESLKCAELARRHGKTTIMGGPHATFDPHSLIRTGLVNTVITGEGEVSFLALLNALDAGESPLQVIQGERIEHLDEIPFPDRELYNMQRILNGPGIFPYPSRYVGIVTSRGCAYDCSFCQPLERRLFGPKVRIRSVENVMREVREVISRYRADFIMFECDTLTTHKKWALELCERMKDLHVRWGAQSRADTLDEEIGEALREAGCMVLFIGFESGSPRMLRLLRKRLRPEQSIRAGKICRDHRILIFANYMLGMPGETEDDLGMTYRMLLRIQPELHSPSYFSPIPGSDLFDYCEAHHLIKIESYEGFMRNPVNEKLRGIDYRMVSRYKEKMLSCRKSLWTETHFAKHAFKRWLFLIRKGFLRLFIMELLNSAPLLAAILRPLQKARLVIRGGA